MRWKKYLPMLLLMTCCVPVVTGCARQVKHVVLAPPESLLTPCERPKMPENMMNGNSLADYAIAATRYIIDLEESFDTCDGKVAAMREFFGKVGERR